MQQVPFSPARAGNYYLFQRCGLLAPGAETARGVGLNINKKWTYNQLNNFLKATFPWLSWLEQDVGGDFNGFSPWALLSLDKKGSRSTLRPVLMPHPTAETFLHYRSPAGKKSTVQYVHIGMFDITSVTCYWTLILFVASRARIPVDIMEQNSPPSVDGAGTSFRILWDTLVENEAWQLEGGLHLHHPVRYFQALIYIA